MNFLPKPERVKECSHCGRRHISHHLIYLLIYVSFHQKMKYARVKTDGDDDDFADDDAVSEDTQKVIT